MTSAQQKRFEEPVLNHSRSDFLLLKQDWTVSETIEFLRQQEIGAKIIYFYVVDETEKLVGIVPTRQLLTSSATQKIVEIMNRRVVAIPQSATVFDACEFFVLHKFFSLPLVDEKRRIVGVVDISLVTEEVLEVSDEEVEDVFEALGFHLSQLRNASPLKALRFRFPWLVTSLCSGTAAAVICGLFERTLSELIILAFFLPLVLGLCESVGMQSMAITIQALRASRPTLRWYGSAVKRELSSAALLGLSCALAVFLIVWAWRGSPGNALAIGSSVCLAQTIGCFLGLSVPAMLHALKLDPKIAAGPVTLALIDITTLLSYFGIATLFLMK
ncbi:MAG: magnesium transporter [Verrucomicrobiota bacterium]